MNCCQKIEVSHSRTEAGNTQTASTLASVAELLDRAALTEDGEAFMALFNEAHKTAALILAAVGPRTANDTQVGGAHYRNMAMQPWDIMETVLTHEEFIGFLKGCVLKHTLRAGKKEGTDDIGKAQHYRAKLLEVQ